MVINQKNLREKLNQISPEVLEFTMNELGGSYSCELYDPGHPIVPRTNYRLKLGKVSISTDVYDEKIYWNEDNCSNCLGKEYTLKNIQDAISEIPKVDLANLEKIISVVETAYRVVQSKSTSTNLRPIERYGGF